MLECTLDDYANVEAEKLKGEFISKDGKTVKLEEISDAEKAEVLIISEATDVVVKGDILYYNSQVEVKDGIATTSGKENAVIIFK